MKDEMERQKAKPELRGLGILPEMPICEGVAASIFEVTFK
jgi:hypothetical protein